jgi:hypothetical protein
MPTPQRPAPLNPHQKRSLPRNLPNLNDQLNLM